MKTQQTLILKTLNVIAWIIFIGLCIEAGAILFSFFLSKYNPEIKAENLYKSLDFYTLKNINVFAYNITTFGVAITLILEAYLFFTIINIFKKINYSSPFTSSIAGLIKKMSVILLDIGILSILTLAYFERYVADLEKFPNLLYKIGHGDVFILFAGIMYFIYQIFSKGIELQNENELTI